MPRPLSDEAAEGVEAGLQLAPVGVAGRPLLGHLVCLATSTWLSVGLAPLCAGSDILLARLVRSLLHVIECVIEEVD